MAKKNYKDWSEEDLIAHIQKLEKRKKHGLAWDEERTLTKELGEGDLEVTPENLKKAFAHTADSFLGLVRQVLDMQYLPDYKDLVARQFETYVIQHNYNADQIRFLRAVQSVFLQKRHLEIADLYEPPLDMFGADAIERWFSETDITAIIEFVQKLDTGGSKQTIGRTDRSI